jgi:hypothetical protein
MTESGVGVPRNIWFLWFQGLSSAPYVVRKCHESWIARNPTWKVTCLDSSSVSNFTPVDYFSGNIGALSHQHKADLLRLDLLAHHGGVWADATCFCVQPLDNWLPPHLNSGFFAFHRPAPDRLLSNWFMAAEPGSILVSRLFGELLSYWGDHSFRNNHHQFLVKVLTRLLRPSPGTRRCWFSRPLRDWLAISPYFAFAYAFEKLINEDRECARIWSQTPKLSADGPHWLQRAVGLQSPASLSVRSEIDRGAVPLYKTTWRNAGAGIPSGSVLEYLLETLQDAGSLPTRPPRTLPRAMNCVTGFSLLGAG